MEDLETSIIYCKKVKIKELKDGVEQIRKGKNKIAHGCIDNRQTQEGCLK